MRTLCPPPGAFSVNQVKIPNVYDETAPLAENVHGVSSQYGVDEKQTSAAYAEIPEGDRDDASAMLFACNPLDKKSAEKKALAQKAENEQIIVTAIMNYFAKSE
jgi:hypothetical protein